jgi:hypothetical protein
MKSKPGRVEMAIYRVVVQVFCAYLCHPSGEARMS